VSTDAVEVNNRLDKVVLAVSGQLAELTPRQARELARALQEAADAAEQTPGS